MVRKKIYTLGRAYAIAYKHGRSVTAIAKFFGKTKHAVECSLYNHGVSPCSATKKRKVATLKRRIAKLRAQMNAI